MELIMKLKGLFLSILLSVICISSFGQSKNISDITNLMGSEMSTTTHTTIMSTSPVKSKVSFNHGHFKAEDGNDTVTGTYKAFEGKDKQVYLIGFGKAADGTSRYFNSLYLPLKNNQKSNTYLYRYKTIISGKDDHMMIIQGIVQVTLNSDKSN